MAACLLSAGGGRDAAERERAQGTLESLEAELAEEESEAEQQGDDSFEQECAAARREATRPCKSAKLPNSGVVDHVQENTNTNGSFPKIEISN